VNDGKNVIMLSAFGVKYEDRSVDFGSQMTRIGANTADCAANRPDEHQKQLAKHAFSDASTYCCTDWRTPGSSL